MDKQPQVVKPTAKEIQQIKSGVSHDLVQKAKGIVNQYSSALSINTTDPAFSKLEFDGGARYIASYDIEGTGENSVGLPNHFTVVLNDAFSPVTWAVLLLTRTADGQTHATVFKDGKLVLDAYYDQNDTVTKGFRINQDGEQEDLSGKVHTESTYLSRLKDCLSNHAISATAIAVFIDVCSTVCIVTAIPSLGTACLDCAAVFLAGNVAVYVYCAGRAIF